jgi:hypothetical protein
METLIKEPPFVAIARELIEKRGDSPAYSLTVKEAATIQKHSYWCVFNQMNQIVNDMEPERKHTRKETAEIFKISLPTLDKYIKLGLIQAERIGDRRILISTAAIRAAVGRVQEAKNIRV